MRLQFLADNARLTNDVNANQKVTLMLSHRTSLLGGFLWFLSEMVQKNSAAQNSANLQSQQEMDLNAAAQKRALDAILQSGQLGGQIQRLKKFHQKAQVAGAS